MTEVKNRQNISDNWIFQLLLLSKYRVLRHLLLISCIGLVLYNSTAEIEEPLLIFGLFLSVFYLNMYVLVPYFLFTNKNALYILSVLAIISMGAIGGHFFNSSSESNDLNIPLFSFFILVLIAASASVKLFQKGIADKVLIDELEKSKTVAELEQLKNQINPHFLFNMLNNANVLTKKDPDKASQVLVKLSDLLRYQLYDSARDKVFLTSDIRFLTDFLNLERVRRDSFDFLISQEGNLSGIQIPPLLFISFVENAVKHNNDTSKLSYVHLYFEIRGNELSFRCVNSKPSVKSTFPTGGLGLVNIKRRLSLLFPSSHQLEIDDKEDEYIVSLMLKL